MHIICIILEAIIIQEMIINFSNLQSYWNHGRRVFKIVPLAFNIFLKVFVIEKHFKILFCYAVEPLFRLFLRPSTSSKLFWITIKIIYLAFSSYINAKYIMYSRYMKIRYTSLGASEQLLLSQTSLISTKCLESQTNLLFQVSERLDCIPSEEIGHLPYPQNVLSIILNCIQW